MNNPYATRAENIYKIALRNISSVPCPLDIGGLEKKYELIGDMDHQIVCHCPGCIARRALAEAAEYKEAEFRKRR